jgi:hypothetical protein
MLAKAFESSFGNTDPFVYLQYCLGLVLTRNELVSLPIYVRSEFELPGWFVPGEVPKHARAAVKMTLKQATQLQDYATQVLCLQLLIMQTPENLSGLFTQLGDLQKRVLGDDDRYLRTLLSSDLVCRTKDDEMRLLSELKQVDNWTEPDALRGADLHLAKEQMERVLAAKLHGSHHHTLTPLRRASMVYYPWLSEHALKFIERLARSDSPPLIRTYSDESTEGGLAWSRPPHPPPRMTGAIPAGRMGQRRGSNHKLRDEHHSSSNDNESDDDNNDRTIELPRNRARGRDVYPTHGRGGRVLRQNITYYTDVIERETVSERKREPLGRGVARPMEVETDDSSDRDKGD